MFLDLILDRSHGSTREWLIEDCSRTRRTKLGVVDLLPFAFAASEQPGHELGSSILIIVSISVQRHLQNTADIFIFVVRQNIELVRLPPDDGRTASLHASNWFVLLLLLSEG